MKVDILASGSKGNCIALTSNNSTILIDAGVPKTKIEKALLDVGILPQNIEAIFITHAHKDHTKGLPLANKYKIPVYAPVDEWKDIKNVDEDNAYSFPAGVGMKLKQFDVKSFKVHHDAFEPVGYSIYTDDTKASICLDTGKVDEEMLLEMKDSDIYIIEANYEPDMVEVSLYPDSVKARIISDVGHLSNEQTADALSKLVKGKGEQIYLTHLSSTNNMPAIARMTVMRALRKKGLVAGKDYELEVIT